MSTPTDTHRIFCFGEFTLDFDRGALQRAGRDVKLRPKSFQVLSYLVERPGRLVSRDELLDAIWADTVVSDDAVTQCLIDIRKALSDSSQSIILTVPRRGYVFELPVTQRGDSDTKSVTEAASARKSLVGKWALAVVAIAVIATLVIQLSTNELIPADPKTDIARDPSIAVLPFSVLSDDTTQTYFADGVSEEILNLLAQQRGLKVIARTSSFLFRDRDVDVSTIAEQLGVTHLLEGSLRNDGDEIRVNVQLIDAMTGEYLWTERFDRALSASNVFAIQSEIASAVSESLKVELSTLEQQRLTKIPTDSLQALDAYFEGRGKMETRNPEELDEASALFEKATELDPEFALAHVAIADVCRLRSNYGTLPFSTSNECSQAAVTDALAINDQLGEAHASLGNLLIRRGNLVGAEQAFLRGIELSPNYAPLYQWYAELLSGAFGRPHDAIPYSKMSVALDPRSAIIRRDHARTLMEMGELDQALDQFDFAIDIDPSLAIGYTGKANLLYRYRGLLAEAIPLYEQALELAPGSPLVANALSYALMDLGDLERAEALIDSTLSLSPNHAGVRDARAWLRVLLGNVPGAVEDARATLDDAPGSPGALKILRDHYVRTRDHERALELYSLYYPSLLDESAQTVEMVGWHYLVAVDLSVLLLEMGRTELARKLLAAARDEADRRQRLRIGELEITLVRINALVGETDTAIALLRRAVDDGWRSGWRLYVRHDPALASLYGSPEFESIVARIDADVRQQWHELEMRRKTPAAAEP